jgi:MoxR-like ATPase
LDRFLLRVRLGYPEPADEERILDGERSREVDTAPLADAPSLAALGDQVATVRMEHPVRRYVVAIANASRVHPELAVGVSPRAVEQMGDAARANALLDGRDYVLPDDVKILVDPVFGHRIVPTTDARIRDRTAEEILREVMGSVPVPTESSEG